VWIFLSGIVNCIREFCKQLYDSYITKTTSHAMTRLITVINLSNHVTVGCRDER